MMGRPSADDVKPVKRSGGANMMKRQQINANVDWTLYVKNLDKISRENLVDSLSTLLLQVKPGISKDVITQYADASGRENFIKTATIQIMSMPEYQLC